MPPKTKQTQKQLQTVIVNIASAAIKKKRKRKSRAKPKTKSNLAGSKSNLAGSVQTIARQEAIQGGLPPFIRTQMPVASNIKTDEIIFQLGDVSRQLQNLQQKQQNSTGSLMATEIAKQEAIQGSVFQEPDKPVELQSADKPLPTISEEPAELPRVKKGRRTNIQIAAARQTSAELAADQLLGDKSFGLEGSSQFSEPAVGFPSTPDTLSRSSASEDTAPLFGKGRLTPSSRSEGSNF
jgi:transcription-repair coupling factor (superfamily II helicase)